MKLDSILHVYRLTSSGERVLFCYSQSLLLLGFVVYNPQSGELHSKLFESDFQSLLPGVVHRFINSNWTPRQFYQLQTESFARFSEACVDKFMDKNFAESIKHGLFENPFE